MENILAALKESQIVVDLGCGKGSFPYDRCPCRIIALDLSLESENLNRAGSRISYLCSNAASIPLASASVDAVFCNHTLEHFPDYQQALSEIGRILKSTGALWISIPDGYGFDDALYRYIYREEGMSIGFILRNFK
jgi:ubiquinone/menaquinone biosynthesis C-methylase UbiE